MVVGFARSYLRDWACHHEVTPSTELGRLFMSLYPNGIDRQEGHQFIEDAAMEEERWGESRLGGRPMDEDEDDVPPLEPVTPPNPPQGNLRAVTPGDEKLDWGEDKPYEPGCQFSIRSQYAHDKIRRKSGTGFQLCLTTDYSFIYLTTSPDTGLFWWGRCKLGDITSVRRDI